MNHGAKSRSATLVNHIMRNLHSSPVKIILSTQKACHSILQIPNGLNVENLSKKIANYFDLE